MDEEADDDIPFLLSEKEFRDVEPRQDVFVDPPKHRRVSKCIDGDNIAILTQVNRKTAIQVCTVLHELGINDVIAFVADWAPQKFGAIEHFIAACIEWNLAFALEDDQLSAYLDKLDEAFYAASTLDTLWGTMKTVYRHLQVPIAEKHIVHFKSIKADCREVKDNCLPVSRELLNQLCQAALDVFVGYTASLARALFICAWAFSMRICEYSAVRVWRRPTQKFNMAHNIRFTAIRTSTIGITCRFLSDKTSKAGDPIKHRMVPWSKLPPYAQGAISAYELMRQGQNYFCMEDGRELDRNAMLNLLEPCLLMMSWSRLSITPHSFHQGRVSQEVFENEHIEDVKHSCRFVGVSKSFDAYCHTDLIALSPEKIFQDFKTSRHRYTDSRICFVAQKLIQTRGPGVTHKFVLQLQKTIPKQFKRVKKEMPERFPGPDAVIWMRAQAIDRQTKVFIRQQQKEMAKKEWLVKRRQRNAAAARRKNNLRRYFFLKNKNLAGMAGPKPKQICQSS